MEPGQLALIIFAVAFLLLVIFIGIFLLRLTRSLGVITMDVDTIARSSNEIFGNANVLLNDINGKVKTLDPTVQAMADLSVTVSKLNNSAQNVTHKFSGVKAGATGVAAAMTKNATKAAMGKFRNKKKTEV
ncbi:DUF948 domain-containing protein [Leuconostoc mesenteroides]|nr:DUF948 domain-containing protein [Leuconostoc mesenteroides]